LVAEDKRGTISAEILSNNVQYKVEEEQGAGKVGSHDKIIDLHS